MSDLNNFHTSKLLIISSTEHLLLVNCEYNEIFNPNRQIVEANIMQCFIFWERVE